VVVITARIVLAVTIGKSDFPLLPKILPQSLMLQSTAAKEEQGLCLAPIPSLWDVVSGHGVMGRWLD